MINSLGEGMPLHLGNNQLISLFRQSIFLKLILSLSLFLSCHSVFAIERSCSPTGGIQSLGAIPGMPNIMKVPANLPIGGVIQRVNVDFRVDCRFRPDMAREINAALGMKSNASGFSDIAETNIPGVGYRVTITVVSGSPQDGTVNLASTVSGVKTFSYGNPDNPLMLGAGPDFRLTGSIEWIKTSAKIGFGDLASRGGKGNFCINMHDYKSVVDAAASWCYQFENVTVAAQAGCTVVSPAALAVQMPTVNVQEIASGKVVEKPFSFNLNCSAGTRLLITINDANNINSQEKTLTLNTGTQSAKGIGIRLRKADQDVPIGSEWLFSGNAMQNQPVALTARYVRLGSSVLAAGQVNAKATFTFRYE